MGLIGEDDVLLLLVKRVEITFQEDERIVEIVVIADDDVAIKGEVQL